LPGSEGVSPLWPDSAFLISDEYLTNDVRALVKVCLLA